MNNFKEIDDIMILGNINFIDSEDVQMDKFIVLKYQKMGLYNNFNTIFFDLDAVDINCECFFCIGDSEYLIGQYSFKKMFDNMVLSKSFSYSLLDIIPGIEDIEIKKIVPLFYIQLGDNNINSVCPQSNEFSKIS